MSRINRGLTSVSKTAVVSIILLSNTAAAILFSFPESQQASINHAFATLGNDTSSITGSLDTGPQSLEYNARYVCGVIIGEDGPLRPGRYNSDINILNRQQYPVSFLWNAVPSSTLQSGKDVSNPFAADTSYKLKTLAPGESISLSCRDFVPSPSLYSGATDDADRYVEGVLTISVDLDLSVQAAISSASTGMVVSEPIGERTSEPSTNILSVDAIYTVNALEVPSREIVLQLIEYTIDDRGPTGKLPSDVIAKPLSVTVPIRTNETVNPEAHVRDILAREYSLNATELQSLDITVRDLSLGVGALDDNHAISLQRINAYQPPPPSFKNSTSP